MGIVSVAKAIEEDVVSAAIATGAAIQQAVQAAIPAPGPAVAPVATISNEPVVLPNTGAQPEQTAQAAPVEVVAPLPAAGGADTSATAATQAGEPTTAAAEPQTKAQQLTAKIEVLSKRIVADTAKREQLEALLRSVDLLDGIKGGSVIVAKVGRAETAKEVVATVVGVQTLENGDKRFKIYFGEGFDADTVVIQESQIVDVRQV